MLDLADAHLQNTAKISEQKLLPKLDASQAAKTESLLESQNLAAFHPTKIVIEGTQGRRMGESLQGISGCASPTKPGIPPVTL